MPPRQFGMLLDFFNTMPVNIVLLDTCYSGGYNASLMEQELRFLTTLTTRALLSPEKLEHMQKEKQSTTGTQITPEQLLKQAIARVRREHHRPYILVSLSAFDDISFGGDVGSWLNSFDKLFDQKPRPTDEELKKLIKNILKRSCDGTPIILMPESDKFELLVGSECFNELLNALAQNPLTTQQSIDLIEEYMQKYKQYSDMPFSALRTMIDLFKRYAIGDDSASTIEKVVKNLIEHKRASTKRHTWLKDDDDGRAALLLTLRLGRGDLSLRLLRYGADANAKDDKGNLALIVALQQKSIGTVKKLLARGADANAKDEKGNSALILAVQKKNEIFVQDLLEKEANLNATNFDGMTALMFAVINNMPDIVQKLLDRGADADVRDLKNHTALAYAIEAPNSKLIEALLDKTADINVQDKNGYTGLMVAIRDNQFALVDKFLARNANANIKDNDGDTALMHAIMREMSSVVGKLLTVKDIDVNAQNNSGISAKTLVQRSDYGNEEIKTMIMRAYDAQNAHGAAFWEDDFGLDIPSTIADTASVKQGFLSGLLAWFNTSVKH